MKIKFFHQETDYTCGSACYRMMVSAIQQTITEQQAIKECLTTKTGTYGYNVHKALLNRGLDANRVNINTTYNEYEHWLNLTSQRRMLYLGCDFVNRACGNRGGRNSHRHHAVMCSDGWIYDPSEVKPVPTEAYYDTYNKNLLIDSMILVDII